MSKTREHDSTLRWSQSLRASQARRAAAARMRTWSRRRRVTATTMAVAVLGFGGVAAAQESMGSSASRSSTAARTAWSSVSAVQAKLGVTADGVLGPQTRRALKSWQRRNGLQADGVIGPLTLGAMGLSTAAATTRAAPAKKRSTTGTASAALQRIAQCESGGDPTAVSSSGQYRGKYQFDRRTWAANGGSGDPAKASEAEQDRIAAKLYAARGAAPWPVCGR